MVIKIGGNTYPLIAAYTTGTDAEWGFRGAYYISLMMDYALAHALFVDGAAWSTMTEGVPETEVDHSDYCVAGKIIDYRNGRIDVLMGRKTEAERLTVELEEAQAEVVNYWRPREAVSVGYRRYYISGWYTCIQAHTTQEDWTPDITPALWAADNPAVEPESDADNGEATVTQPWEQKPTGYAMGDIVLFEGTIYVSTINGNVWSPIDYPQGWEVVTI